MAAPDKVLDVHPWARGPVAEYGHCWPSKRYHPLNLHRNSGIELVLQTKGRNTWIIEGQSVPAVAGTLTFTLPWEAHMPDNRLLGGNELHFAV
ncbi:MAG: hypothetical protein IT440_08565, partial [Phycisphaeraceae bacterium]|nr:hypothetical protein [Phycisphaeraceae bacterium]